ncbi:MAG: hypothetical protein KGL52_19060 [Rhodospirillales bacterium]|nr:hypothetical protein [Rhodospirillales bacterium]
MNTHTTRLLATAVLTLGVATAPAALAQPLTPASLPSKPPAQTGGQGIMGGAGAAQGHGMMGGGTMGSHGGGMMGMMSAMTRMASNCNRMMESANNKSHHPAASAPGKAKS